MSSGTRSISRSRIGQGANAGALSGLESGARCPDAAGRGGSARTAIAQRSRWPPADAEAASLLAAWARTGGNADGCGRKPGTGTGAVWADSALVSAEARLKEREREAGVLAAALPDAA